MNKNDNLLYICIYLYDKQIIFIKPFELIKNIIKKINKIKNIYLFFKLLIVNFTKKKFNIF